MAQGKSIAERLGYPADSKLLIIHADDLAVAHAVDRASFDAFERRAITSASVMVPCPWFTEAAAYAKEHPEADLGLHLTLTSEWKSYRWGPVAPIDKVPGLLGPDGYFYPDVVSVAQHATPEEVEREIRAQVERGLAAGIQPTHLDTHMGTVYASPQFAAAYMKVAREYRLPFLAMRQSPIPVPHMAEIVALLKDSDIVLDALVSARPGTPAENWEAAYLEIIRNLKPGLTQLIVHLGYDDAELQAISAGHPDFGAAWRQRDFDVITSPEFKKALEENHVILVGWKDLKKLL
jgi:predicted glycoside hydrolase/deacetylase ChbG (UPF0249 family)